jgi:DNA repair exonuclease SbcCD ATPase subunit
MTNMIIALSVYGGIATGIAWYYYKSSKRLKEADAENERLYKKIQGFRTMAKYDADRVESLTDSLLSWKDQYQQLSDKNTQLEQKIANFPQLLKDALSK